MKKRSVKTVVKHNERQCKNPSCTKRADGMFCSKECGEAYMKHIKGE